MTYILTFLLDLRDFAYVHYSNRYGKVTAKKWSGYPLLFACIFLAYYLFVFTIISKSIPHNGLFLNLKYSKPILYYIFLSSAFVLPLPVTCNCIIKKLEIIRPLYYKSASSEYSRKERRGWITLVLGWILFFSLFWIFDDVK